MSEHLIAEVQQFDPSDDYHLPDGDLDAKSYYAALDRVVALLDGRIQTWTDRRSAPEPASEATTAPLSDEQGGDGRRRSAGSIESILAEHQQLTPTKGNDFSVCTCGITVEDMPGYVFAGNAYRAHLADELRSAGGGEGA